MAEKRKWAEAGPAIWAAALALALYAITIGGTYIYDDTQIIGADLRIRSPSQWKDLWTKDYFNGAIDNLYRPLTSQTYAIQWWIHGSRPWAFHLVNILLHAAAAAAVAELARRLAGVKAAYVAGLLFAAHPIHVEAVAGIVGRAEELCMLFIAMALVLFLRRPLTGRRVLAIWLCSVAAMLSKEQGMLLPFLLLALHWLVRRRETRLVEFDQLLIERRAMRLLTLAMCWSLAALIVLREEVLKLRFEWEKGFLDVSIQPLIRSGPMDRVLMVFVLLGHYAQLMVAPVKLSIDYGESVFTSVADRHDPYLYIGIVAAVAAVAALVVALRCHYYAAAFCLIAAGLTYGMISNIVLIGAIFGERLMYLPSAFVLIWAGIYLSRWRGAVLVPVMTVLLLLACLRTETYAARWNNRFEFYEAGLAEQPRSVRLHELVIGELMDRGKLNEAAEVAVDGRRVAADYWNIWLVSGQIAERQGDLKEADRMYHKSFDLQPLATSHGLMIEVERKMARQKAGG